jgi:hypothetical protein
MFVSLPCMFVVAVCFCLFVYLSLAFGEVKKRLHGHLERGASLRAKLTNGHKRWPIKSDNLEEQREAKKWVPLPPSLSPVFSRGMQESHVRCETATPEHGTGLFSSSAYPKRGDKEINRFVFSPLSWLTLLLCRLYKRVGSLVDVGNPFPSSFPSCVTSTSCL